MMSVSADLPPRATVKRASATAVHAAEKRKLSRAAAVAARTSVSTPLTQTAEAEVMMLPPIGSFVEDKKVVRYFRFEGALGATGTIGAVFVVPAHHKKDTFTKAEWTRMTKAVRAHEESKGPAREHSNARFAHPEWLRDSEMVEEYVDAVEKHWADAMELNVLAARGIYFKQWTPSPGLRYVIPPSCKTLYKI